jgi:DNA-binding MarR family transcriptional regulator
MNQRTASLDRTEQMEYVSTQLLSHTALLARLLTKQVGHGLSFSEAGVLRVLADGPRRITEIAELEGFAQPTTTLLVKRLEEQGLVSRERQTDDQRVVLVSLTSAGTATLEDFRVRAHATLRKYLDEMSDEQLKTLALATDALAELTTTLIGEPLASGASR